MYLGMDPSDLEEMMPWCLTAWRVAQPLVSGGNFSSRNDPVGQVAATPSADDTDTAVELT